MKNNRKTLRNKVAAGLAAFAIIGGGSVLTAAPASAHATCANHQHDILSLHSKFITVKKITRGNATECTQAYFLKVWPSNSYAYQGIRLYTEWR